MPLNGTSAKLRPYLAEIGRAAFASVAIMSLAALLLEYFAPDVVGNYVSPQHLAAIAAVAVGLSLLDRAPAPRYARVAYALTAALSAAVACSAAWRYLEGIPEARGPVAAAAAGAVLLAFLVFARRPPG